MEKTLHAEPRLLLGDCLEEMRKLEQGSIDAVVTDPPYGLSQRKKGGGKSKGGFMGLAWDYDVPSVEKWQECLRVLKPGGSLLAFAGTRTQHRMAINIEDAGFKIKDVVSWVQASGFPKNLNISKALAKIKGIDPELVRKWEGFGTALKPAHETITWAVKPPYEEELNEGPKFLYCPKASRKDRNSGVDDYFLSKLPIVPTANLVEKDLKELLGDFVWVPDDKKKNYLAICHKYTLLKLKNPYYKDKVSVEIERGGKGIEKISLSLLGSHVVAHWEPLTNTHATVKPTELMRWLCRLAAPSGGTILDPFMGSGSTGKAALLEGLDFVGIEMEPSYMEIARLRIQGVRP